MAESIIDSLVVLLTLDTKGFVKGQKDVEDASKKLRDNSEKTFGAMEARGKSTAETFKNVRNEVVALSLAFLGASSLAGLVGGMMSGAAAADKLGMTMGMSAKQIWAWRMAMKGVPGGQSSDADSALATIQGDRMAYKTGQFDRSKAGAYARLGIGKADFDSGDAGSILKKLAAAQSKLDPELYARMLQNIGMNSSMIYFLQQGQTSVDRLIKGYEKDSDGQEKLAKQSEKLTEATAKLEATISGQLVGPLTDIVSALNSIFGAKSVPDAVEKFAHAKKGSIAGQIYDAGHADGVWFKKHFGSSIKEMEENNYRLAQQQRIGGGGQKASGATGSTPYMAAFLAAGLSPTMTAAILGNMQYESSFDPSRVGDHGHARGVLQWHEDRQADYRRLFGGDVASASPNQVAAFVLWELHHRKGTAAIMAAASTGNAALTATRWDKIYEASAGFTRNLRAQAATGYARQMTVHQTNTYHIKSTDPRAAAHEISRIHSHQRRHAVAQADQGVAP